MGEIHVPVAYNMRGQKHVELFRRKTDRQPARQTDMLNVKAPHPKKTYLYAGL